MMKRLISCLIGASLAVTLAGCGANQSATTNDKGVTISIFSDIQKPMKGDSNYDLTMAWLTYTEEKTGLKLDFETAPASNYKEKLQIMLVSGNYPDLIKFNNHYDAEFVSAVDNGIVVPVNDWLGKMPNLMKYTNKSSFDAFRIKQDDKIYGVPISTIIRSDGFAVRKDWLDKVGLSLPEDGYVTMDEFVEILKRFTFNDPDGNGQNDTYGFGWHMDGEKNFLPGITETFGLLGWQKSNGSYEYMDPKFDRESDNYRKALEFNAKLFKQKLIDPESPVLDLSGATTRFIRGLTGVIPEFPGYLYDRISEMKKINPAAEIAYIQGIKNEDGTVDKFSEYSTGYYNFWAISNQNKHKEESLKLLDWLLSDDGWDKIVWGMEGYQYNVENGERVRIPGVGNSMTGNLMRRSDGIDKFLPVGLKEAKPYMPMMEKALKESMTDVTLSLDKGFRPEITSSQKFIDAQKALNQQISKILLGTAPAESYKKALDDWYANGGEEYVQEMNSYIKKSEGK